ncbi:hypothetical protein NQ317_007472 [Molorchus minor]|uniref:Gustatory receptor n=1 Tax=Molorchus minor TaxID=1323400 RepID=A0ABQ9K1S7_9CUCU|nr:hypothetical protein NQ317_007472 [Molorchus minor]
MSHDANLDIRYISNLMKLTEKLGITAPLKKSSRFKYYSFTIMTAIIIETVYSTHELWTSSSAMLFNGTSLVLRIFCILSFAIMNVVTMVVAVLNAETWITFMKLFQFIDCKLNKGQTIVSPAKSNLKMELLFWHCLMFCFFGYDGYLWYTNNGLAWLKFYICTYINAYYGAITVLLVAHFASAIRERFKRVNNILIKTNGLRNVINAFISNGAADKINNLQNTDEVTECYLLLTELVDMFNKLFGWQIFFMTVNIVVQILEIVNGLMNDVVYSQGSSNVLYDSRIVIFLVASLLLILFLHARVVIFCEDINNESRNTLTICYNLQQTVDPNSDDRKELIILGDLVDLLKPKTNAARYYDINRGLLSRVFGYLISYSIVIIQFSKQQ